MNWRLIFTGLKSPGWAIYGCILVALVIGFSLMLLRLERKLVSRTVGWTLLTLRVGMLLSLLAILLQPVLIKQFDVALRGRVVVAVDGSQSMETRDQHASLAEKLRWAKALGMVGNAETADRIELWIRSAEAGEEPDWLGTGAPPANAAEQAAFDSRASQVRQTVDEIAGMPRVEFVRRLLQSQPHVLLDKLEEVMPIDLRVFASEQQSTTAKELTKLLDSDRIEIAPGGTDAIDFLQSLTTEESANQIRGVILLSDGRQTIPGDSTGLATRLGSLNIPVYSVPIGSRLPPRDLSIVAVDAPEAVFLNDKAQIRAVIGTSGFEGEPISVRLEKNGIEVDRQTITPSTDNASVTFVVPSDQPGRFDYRLMTDVQAGELREDNNGRELSVHVVNNKARVMLVDGDPRWEFRYLKNLLERDKQVDSQLVLFRQPYLNLLNQPYIATDLPALEVFRQQLAGTDLLILGDISSEEIDAGVWEIIEQAVARDGLSLVVIPGRNHMPHSVESSQLSALLPITDSRQRIAEQLAPTAENDEQSVFRLSLSQEAMSLPMFQLSADPADQNTMLLSLPGHPWIYGATAKPGASVWATSSIVGVNVAPEPTILHHDYGFGQVVWLGLDSTWRWRYRAGDQWHYKFWGQLIRWATRNKASSGNENVRLSLSDIVVDEADSVSTSVRWDPRLLAQLQDATVSLVATPVVSDNHAVSGTDASETVPPTTALPGPEKSTDRFVTELQPSAEAPEKFQGRLPRLPAGEWQVELQVTGGTFTLKEPVRSELLVRKQLSAELANVSCNRELLTQLSEFSGGQVVEPADTEELLTLIQPRDEQQEKIQERTLWDHWLVLCGLFGLLTAEWVVRKLNGLP